MSDISTLNVKVTASAGDFGAGLRGAGKELDGFAGKVKGIGAGIGDFASSAGLGILGGAAAVGVGIKRFADFDQGLADVRAAANLSAQDLDRVRESALNISKNTGTGPTQIITGMNELLKAGMDVEGVLGGAGETVAKFAKIAEMDVGESATVINDALNVFKADGLDAAGAADILSKAADASSISVQQVAQSFAMTSANAANAGMSMRETAAAIAVLGNAGVKGSDAGTSLKTMLLSLQAPSDTGASVIQKFGLSFRDAAGHMLPMRGIISELQNKLAGLEPAARDQALKDLLGADAMRAGLILMSQGVDGYDSFNKKIDESLGVNEKFAIVQDTVKGNFGATMAALDRLAISLGSLIDGPLSALLGMAGKVIQFFADVGSAVGKAVDGVGKWLGLTGSTPPTVKAAAAATNDLGNATTKAAAAQNIAAVAVAAVGAKTGDVTKDVATLTAKLQEQIATVNMSSSEAEVYKLAQKGAGVADLERVRGLAAQLDLLEANKKAHEEMANAAKKYIEEIKDPWEKLMDQLREINDLERAGLLTAGQANRASEKLANEVAKAEADDRAKLPASSSISNVKLDSLERRFTAGFTAANVPWQKDVAANTASTAKSAKEIARNTRKRDKVASVGA